jgi:hypothetical protein
MKISNEKIKQWEKLLRRIPVSVNNFYGDPLIQWQDTVKKLDDLHNTKHEGPVGIITKGIITENHAKKLSEFIAKGLNIIVLVSISELPQFEKIGTDHRYENIKLLNKHAIPNIAYIRPLIPPYNTSEKIIKRMFKKLNKAGSKVVVVSGFRGDDGIIKDTNPDEKVEFVLRVKVMTKDVYSFVKESASKYNIHLFTRTACAVSYLVGDKNPYNPYYYSPNLVNCDELKCPLRKTCKPTTEPRSGSMEFIKFLGYKAELMGGNCDARCQVKPDNRLKCPSCCTTCFFIEGPRISVKGKIRLGDLTFIRFITGMLAMQPGRRDDESRDIAKVSLPKFPEIKKIECLNSWWPYAHTGDKCFGCNYCIEKYYGTSRRNFGFPPAQLIKKIFKNYEA